MSSQFANRDSRFANWLDMHLLFCIMSYMKPQDVLITLKIISFNSDDWRIIDIAYNLHLSSSEVHDGINRLHQSEIMHMRKHVVKSHFVEFLIHGIKYCFPAILGMKSRGILTTHSSEFFKKIISDKKMDNYVWPSENGNATGISVNPLYKSVPEFVQKDRFMYEYLSYIDAIRIGRKRERAYAEKQILKLLR